MSTKSKIFYTLTDEAPLLATYSFYRLFKHLQQLLILKWNQETFQVTGRILAIYLQDILKKTKVEDALSELGKLATTPEANIIKLPNISASVPQLKTAIAELQSRLYLTPTFLKIHKMKKKKAIKAKYAKVLGSAVNPVLRRRKLRS